MLTFTRSFTFPSRLGRLNSLVNLQKTVTKYRALSYVSSSEKRTVQVPVGASGDVEIDILPPLKPTNGLSQTILVHLPSRRDILQPSSISIDDADSTRSSLSSLLPTTSIVTIKYRLAPAPSPYTYPIPIHDTAIAFNHILSTIDSRNPSAPAPKICLHGSHIGASLAVMLALTQPNCIHSLAIHSPLVNWVGLEEHASKPTFIGLQKRKKEDTVTYAEVESAKALMQLRTSLFRTPSAYFDPFASPTLVLRAPGRDTPLSHNIEDQPNKEDDEDLSEAFGPYDDNIYSLTSQSELPEDAASLYPTHKSPPKRRKVLQRWPLTGRPESAMLPHSQIFFSRPSAGDGLTTLLQKQGLELAELMRRACFMGRERGFAEDRVGVAELSDVDSGMDEISKWIRKKFDEP